MITSFSQPTFQSQHQSEGESKHFNDRNSNTSFHVLIQPQPRCEGRGEVFFSVYSVQPVTTRLSSTRAIIVNEICEVNITLVQVRLITFSIKRRTLRIISSLLSPLFVEFTNTAILKSRLVVDLLKGCKASIERRDHLHPRLWLVSRLAFS